MYEVAFTVEGYQSNGNANVTRNVLTIGGSSSGGGNTTVELRCVNDNNTWDVNLDYLEITAAN